MLEPHFASDPDDPPPAVREQAIWRMMNHSVAVLGEARSATSPFPAAGVFVNVGDRRLLMTTRRAAKAMRAAQWVWLAPQGRLTAFRLEPSAWRVVDALDAAASGAAPTSLLARIGAAAERSAGGATETAAIELNPGLVRAKLSDASFLRLDDHVERMRAASAPGVVELYWITGAARSDAGKRPAPRSIQDALRPDGAPRIDWWARLGAWEDGPETAARDAIRIRVNRWPDPHVAAPFECGPPALSLTGLAGAGLWRWSPERHPRSGRWGVGLLTLAGLGAGLGAGPGERAEAVSEERAVRDDDALAGVTTVRCHSWRDMSRAVGAPSVPAAVERRVLTNS
ncbi:MAG: hypothetical protein AAGM38_05000 [Pseudomonadota bacterium]